MNFGGNHNPKAHLILEMKVSCIRGIIRHHKAQSLMFSLFAFDRQMKQI